MRFWLATLVVTSTLFLVPSMGFAADTSFLGPIVPQCMTFNGATDLCQACDLVTLADNLIKFFAAFSVFVATIMFAWAGFLYVSAAASEENLKKAKSIFGNVFIGLILVLAAWLIIDLILRSLSTQSLNVLTDIECVPFQSSGATIPAPPAGGVQGGGAQTPPAGGTGQCTNCVPITAFKCKNPESCSVSPEVNLQLIDMRSKIIAAGGNPDDYIITETGVNQTVTHASGVANLDLSCATKIAGNACSSAWVKSTQSSWSGRAVYETNSLADYNAKIAAGVPASSMLLLTGTFDSNGVCSAGTGKCITAPHISLKK